MYDLIYIFLRFLHSRAPRPPRLGNHSFVRFVSRETILVLYRGPAERNLLSIRAIPTSATANRGGRA